MSKNAKDDSTLTIGKLAKVSGFRQSTLKYYTEIGILPFDQDGERLLRKYKKTMHRTGSMRSRN